VLILRIKFSKDEDIKMVGHLDLLRNIQRTIKRAELPVIYSQGYNPHQLISFAQPLTLGFTSSAEYFDLGLKEEMDLEIIKEKLNKNLSEGLKILKVKEVAKDAPKSMTLVDAASYNVYINKKIDKEKLINALETLNNMSKVIIQKKTKKGIKSIDIKENILDIKFIENNNMYGYYMMLSAGENGNIKPETLIKLILDIEYYDLLVNRNNLYHFTDNKYITLEEL